jgi:hypothetical protein
MQAIAKFPAQQLEVVLGNIRKKSEEPPRSGSLSERSLSSAPCERPTDKPGEFTGRSDDLRTLSEPYSEEFLSIKLDTAQQAFFFQGLYEKDASVYTFLSLTTLAHIFPNVPAGQETY